MTIPFLFIPSMFLYLLFSSDWQSPPWLENSSQEKRELTISKLAVKPNLIFAFQLSQSFTLFSWSVILPPLTGTVDVRVTRHLLLWQFSVLFWLMLLSWPFIEWGPTLFQVFSLRLTFILSLGLLCDSTFLSEKERHFHKKIFLNSVLLTWARLVIFLPLMAGELGIKPHRKTLCDPEKVHFLLLLL